MIIVCWFGWCNSSGLGLNFFFSNSYNMQRRRNYPKIGGDRKIKFLYFYYLGSYIHLKCVFLKVCILGVPCILVLRSKDYKSTLSKRRCLKMRFYK